MQRNEPRTPCRPFAAPGSVSETGSASASWRPPFLGPPLLAVALALGASACSGVAHGPARTPAAVSTSETPAAVDDALEEARDTIQEEDVERHIAMLAAPELEGRDSPSVGLERAAVYLEQQLASFGFRGVGADGSFRVGFSRALPAPDPERCSLRVDGEAAALESDFVPLAGCAGAAEGELVFAGFGIDRKGYDELAKRDLDGNIALIVEGEPRHKKLFEGPEVVTEAADVYAKVEELVKADVAGVLVVRRMPAEATTGPDGEALTPPTLGYRYTWADWNPATTEQAPRQRRSFRTPVLEVTPAFASALLGEDVLKLAERMDSRGKPLRPKDLREGQTVSLSSGFENRRVAIDNVVGLLEGSDADLSSEVLVLGAHYDHIGVDPRGRVGFGADDNGSGTSAMLEVAQALGAHPPRRSVLLAFFAAEEDGLLGSASLADAPPVPRESLVAMLNMDMVGRGDEKEVVVLGTRQNPDLEEVLDDAKRVRGTGIKNVVTNRAEHLWQRSDHYSFHRAGVPVLFFFEAVSETQNRDYHTFRDTAEAVNVEKIANTARLCLHVAWQIANADERPGAPRNR